MHINLSKSHKSLLDIIRLGNNSILMVSFMNNCTENSYISIKVSHYVKISFSFISQRKFEKKRCYNLEWINCSFLNWIHTLQTVPYVKGLTAYQIAGFYQTYSKNCLGDNIRYKTKQREITAKMLNNYWCCTPVCQSCF